MDLMTMDHHHGGEADDSVKSCPMIMVVSFITVYTATFQLFKDSIELECCKSKSLSLSSSIESRDSI